MPYKKKSHLTVFGFGVFSAGPRGMYGAGLRSAALFWLRTAADSQAYTTLLRLSFEWVEFRETCRKTQFH